MTEDEAKKKWCPFVRQSATFGSECGDYAVSFNRSANSPALAAPCIGSACMAWRWAMEADGETPLYRRTPTPGQRGHFDNSPVGYCGLAGRP